MTVHVLLVEHRHGVNVSAHKTEAGAQAELDSYVRQYWSELEKSDGIFRNQSVNPAERIGDYFQDHPDNESFSIHQVEVQA